MMFELVGVVACLVVGYVLGTLYPLAALKTLYTKIIGKA